MTDLITRLRALADNINGLTTEEFTLVREAADALAVLANHKDTYTHLAQKAERERDAIKARFERLDETLSKVARERDEARAEAALDWVREESDNRAKMIVDLQAKLAEEAKRLNDAGMDFWRERSRAEKAEAEAGALLERVKKLEAALQHYAKE